MLLGILLLATCQSICPLSWTRLIISRRNNIYYSIPWRRYINILWTDKDSLHSEILFFFSPHPREIHLFLSNFLFQVIVRQSVDKAEFQDSSVEKILNLLFNHCESEEEGVRNVVAECLGKIALIKPAKLVPALKVSSKIVDYICIYIFSC